MAIDAALAAAVAAAESGDWAACLARLLETWRAAPAPLLAALIERVSPRAAGPAVGGTGSLTRAVARRIAAATAADVPPIVEVALRQMRTFPRAYRWVVELAKTQPRDPRIAAALVEIAKFAPWTDMRRDAEGTLMADVTTALDAIDDPRYRAWLVAESARHEQRRRYIRKHRPGLDRLRDIAAAIAARPAPPALALDEPVARIDAALVRVTPAQARRRGNTADLLAAIHADPADTGLRTIYADALQDAGDPRGEFIALQCARGDRDPPSRRERELLSAHARAWLGEIEPIVNKQGLVYRRGFVACAREGLKYVKHYPLLGSPVWSTIEELDVSVWDKRAVAFLRDPRWRVLRRVFGVQCRETVLGLAGAGACLPWTTLGIRYPTGETWDALLSIVPDLVELDLTDADGAVAILGLLAGHALGARVKRYRVATRHVRAEDLVRACPAGAELELVRAYAFPGDPQGAAVRIAGGRATLVHHERKIDASYAVEVLGALERIDGVELVAGPSARVDEPSWQALGEVLARHGLELARPG